MRRSGFFISLTHFAGQEADNSIDVYIRDEHMDVLEDSGKRPLQRSLRYSQKNGYDQDAYRKLTVHHERMIRREGIKSWGLG